MSSPLSKLAEARIDEAIASGEWVPPPAGTSLDLEGYFSVPVEWRASYSMLKGNGFVTPELELLQQAEKLEEQLAECQDPQHRISLRREIESLRVRFRLAAERLRGRR